MPGLVERYQRRTCRLTGQLGAVVKEPQVAGSPWTSAPGARWNSQLDPTKGPVRIRSIAIP